MNEAIPERFGHSKRGHRPEMAEVQLWFEPQRLNTEIREYFDTTSKPTDGGQWLDRPEIPSAAELLDADVDGSSTSDIVEIAPNRPQGAWESKETYLSAQYELLREDALRPLREAVSQVRFTPTAAEEAFNGSIGIYEKVHVSAFTCSTRGISTRITFSTVRAGKKILWEQSKRLIRGSLVVLTPASDMFKTTAVVATVAARPLSTLQQNPPEIDLFIARAEELEIDPEVEWVMIEERSGFFEADRHTLMALQKLKRESFPLSKHLVEAVPSVSPPEYLLTNARKDLSTVLTDNKHETYENVDVLRGWPKQPHSDLDASQMAALRRVLTKRLAIVQGPPGTGKTFISVQAIKVMLANHEEGDPPIIVTCQTNHALDQLLLHLAEFNPDFVRLGGRSKDRGIIKARTLYEVRQSTSENPLPGCWAPNARKKMRELEKEIRLIVDPLQPGKTPLDHGSLHKLGLLTEKQAKTLEAGASQWVQDQLSNPNEARSPFVVWLGQALIRVPMKQLPEEFGFEYEEADLEFEQLKEIEAENFAKDDEEIDSLVGNTYNIADNFTGRKVVGTTDQRVKELLKEQDMWKIPEAARGPVYFYLQAELKKKLSTGFREKAKAYNEQAAKRRIGNWEKDENILKKQKVIGLTTTGFSKYRALIAALEPKVVLIEEAAETLEAPVIATCVPSLEHLILVGDHQQLRPHCHVKAHEDKPYYLNISLFERMINNKIEFDTLSKQRRMIPEIRRVLYPVYGDLIKDHASVLNPVHRPNVPGMGGVNSFFFTHQYAEQRDDHMSCVNPEEAEMIVGFVEYLVHNGMETKDITVLTFYNGQRKRILYELRQRVNLTGRQFNVVTVDSYQGEENKVVILSLVRSNDKKAIGFLNVDNRVCVALSRAQCGFYLFGNGMLLYEFKTWRKVLDIMAGHKLKKERPKTEPISRVNKHLPVRCSNHNNVTKISSSADWDKITGGCEVKCTGELQCGHKCDLSCHPFSHDNVRCQKACCKTLGCGHQCSAICGEPCTCTICVKGRAPAPAQIAADPFDGKETLSQNSSAASWQSFAQVEPSRYASEVANSGPPSQRPSPQKPKHSQLLEIEPAAEELEQLDVGMDGGGSERADSPFNAKIVEKKMKDGRVSWKEQVTVTPVAVANESNHVKDWSKEESLLD